MAYKSIESQADIFGQSIIRPESEEHKTTVSQTYVHLLKGYMGAGCLSLPWAVSQLGLYWGSIAIFSVSYWSSYNCWTIVKLKRFVEGETCLDGKASEASSVTMNTQVSYAAVGEYFYGSKFGGCVSACVCTQQLAICTVFVSFVGENLLAVMERLNFMATQRAAMTLELPIILGLSLIPNLKSLTPVMTIGTFLLLMSFFAIGVIVQREWPTRPSEPIEFDIASAPLAVCAILYSYEGINLILPVESAMVEPQNFGIPFILAMFSVALILASFSLICVISFGEVTSGSVTAFLVEVYSDDPDMTWWLMIANAAISVSVLVTYPLQLFPVLQLLEPSFSRFLSTANANDLVGQAEGDDLSGFDPLPALPEHDVPAVEELDEQHQYSTTRNSMFEEVGNQETGDNTGDDESNSITFSAITSMQSIFPAMTMSRDSALLRGILVLLTYSIAVVVPNVQALISLAGALAGSSSALLIPPMLELAWIEHLEKNLQEAGEAGDSAAMESRWTVLSPGTEHFGLGKWWFEKLKCYSLLLFGFLLFFIGTYASVADIVRI